MAPELKKAAVYANMPINDMIAWNVAIDRATHNPYAKNIAPRNPYTPAMFPNGSFLGSPAATAAFFNSGAKPQRGYNDQDFWAVDTKLLIQPTDNFKVTIAGDWARKNDSGGTQIYSTTPEFLQAFIPIFFESVGIPGVRLPPGFVKGSDGKFTMEKSIPAFADLQDYGGSITAVYSLPNVDLTSITAYRAQQTNFFEALDAAPVPMLDVLVRNRKGFVYQEFRAVSTGEGPFHYLGGGTYLSTHFKGMTDLSIFLPLVPEEPTVRSKDHVKNWSIYGQVGYDFTPRLNLTVSGRYVHEKNEARFSFPDNSATSMTGKKFLPSATLSYKLDDNGNVYARFARGFKAGGVNPVASPSAFPDPNQGSTFKPEVVDTYEVGFRGALLERKMQVTTAFFYNDYSNLQVSAHANPEHPEIILAIVNAGSARTWGWEGNVTWRVSEPLTLGVAAGYLNAKYKHFAVTDATVLVPFDLSGSVMLNSPKWQLSLTANLDQPINDKFRLVANAVGSHVSGVLFQPSGAPGLIPDATAPGYWVANLRVGVRTADDKYGLAVFANNLFNEGYATYGSSSAASGGNLLTWGNPRIVGVEATTKF